MFKSVSELDKCKNIMTSKDYDFSVLCILWGLNSTKKEIY